MPTLRIDERTPDPRAFINGMPMELNPYFGFTFKRDYHGANNYGFPSEAAYPYCSATNEFVVGVFGGSVAMGQVVSSTGRGILEEGLHALLASNGFDRVKVLCFAAGGWRQPQTFYAMTYFLNSLDMVIVLDGYNDVNQCDENSVMKWPARYPWANLYKLLASPKISHEALLAIGEISILSHRLQRWTDWFAHRPLNRSLFAHSVWKVGADRCYARIQKERKTLSDGTAGDLDYATLTAHTRAEADAMVDDYFHFYESLSRWQADIAESEGVPYFHFLQPNQYVEGTKPYSQEELDKYLGRGRRQTERISAHYRRLGVIVSRLATHGYDVYSLVDLFQNTSETVYRDDCCHFNEEGVAMLGNGMLEPIRRALAADADGRARFRGLLVVKHAGPPPTASATATN